MSAIPKPTQFDAHHIALFDRLVDPPPDDVRGHRIVEHARYMFEVWLGRGGHLMRFDFGSAAASEYLLGDEASLASAGPVSLCPCIGERDFEHRFERAGVVYLNTFQTETLSQSLYLATLEELREMACEAGALATEWTDAGGPCLSMVDVQRYRKQVHAQGYHLQARNGLVIRTQTIFEHS